MFHLRIHFFHDEMRQILWNPHEFRSVFPLAQVLQVALGVQLFFPTAGQGHQGAQEVYPAWRCFPLWNVGKNGGFIGRNGRLSPIRYECPWLCRQGLAPTNLRLYFEPAKCGLNTSWVIKSASCSVFVATEPEILNNQNWCLDQKDQKAGGNCTKKQLKAGFRVVRSIQMKGAQSKFLSLKSTISLWITLEARGDGFKTRL